MLKRRFFFLARELLLVSALFALLRAHSSAGQPLEPTALTVISPSASGVTLAELDDFATTVMGDPWDMNENSDLSYYRSASELTNAAFANGIFSARMNGNAIDGAERMILLAAGAPNNTAMRIGKIGYNFPIDASRYRYLSYRLYKSNSSCNSGLVLWFSDDSYASSAMGVSNSFAVPQGGGCAAGWHIIVLDLATIGIQQGGKGWSGTIRELSIHPFSGSGAENATVRLDWARLMAADPRTARPYTIQWTGNGSGGDVTLYASLGNKTLDGDDLVIATGRNPGGGSLSFQTGVLPPGTYYVAAKNNSTTAWSGGPLIINSPPQTTITKPSMTSGEDFAESVLGDAWDMSNSSDLNDVVPPWWETCVGNETFAGGIYSANLTTCSSNPVYSDAKLVVGHLDPPGPDPVVDTSRFRYLSFRHSLSGEQDVAEGWVSRFGWWQVMPGGVTEPVVMSRDIILHEGWNIYKADLWAPDAVDESHPAQIPWTASAPNRLRLDPAELYFSRFPATVQIDWMKLTAMDEVFRGAPFPIRFSVRSNHDVSLTFYYDADTNPNNGRTLIGSTTSVGELESVGPETSVVSLAGQGQVIYVPLIVNKLTSFSCVPPDCYVWNTTGVLRGTYYVCVNSQDAFNSTYRCSEAPMVVR